MKRFQHGVLLSIGLAVVGFTLGGVLAAAFMVHPGDGLAGSAEVAIVAIGGMFAGSLGGILLTRALRPAALPRATGVGLLLAAGSVGLLAWRGKQEREQREQARITEAMPVVRDSLPPALPAPGAPDSLIGLVVVAPDSLARFETRELAEEMTAVTVYAQVSDWYLVGSKGGGRSWLNSRSAGAYYPLEQLIVDRLNWLTEAWDTRLRAVPEPSAVAIEADVPRAGGQEVPAKVLEVSRQGGTLWLKVEVLRDSPCEGGTPAVIATGWIPAWGRDGKPTAWFYARGC